MQISRDIKKLAAVFGVLCLASAIMGSALTILVHSRYAMPVVVTQASSKLDNLKLAGRFDRLVLEVQGYTTQTTNLIEAQQSDDDVVFSVSNDGNVLISGTLTTSSTLTFAGDLDMGNNEILNIGAAGTDFQDDGGLVTASTITVTAGGLVVTAGGLDMTNDAITNIGNSGTDFDSSGGLTTASTVTVTAGGLVVTAGGATVTAGGLDMTNDAISNVGAAGTDFDTNGGLTTASTITVTAGGLVIVAGDLTLENDELIQNDVNGTVTLHIAGADEWDFTADQLDATNGQIVNIGAAGTDFSGTGGLTLADLLTISSGGATISGDIDGDAEFQVGTFLNLTVQTEISVTNSAVFTPTGSYQLIAAAAEVTPTVSTSGFTTGDLVELHNTETAVINFEATGLQYLKDDYPMDQYDVLGLRFNGTGWVELYRTGPRI